MDLNALRRWRLTGEKPTVLEPLPRAIAEQEIHPADLYSFYVYDPTSGMMWPNEQWATDDSPTFPATEPEPANPYAEEWDE